MKKSKSLIIYLDIQIKKMDLIKILKILKAGN